jgi:hypothetical protein
VNVCVVGQYKKVVGKEKANTQNVWSRIFFMASDLGLNIGGWADGL